MEADREYNLRIRGNVLSFRTGSFRAEPGSALHSGIYNRELISSLAAGAVMVAIALLAVIKGVEVRLFHYIGAIVLFGALTLLARFYLFYEEYLSLSIDRQKGELEVVKRTLAKQVMRRGLDELTGVRKGFTVIAPENQDGIDIVKNISLQHGMVIPGFGESKEYHSVHLEFGELDTVAIFSTEEPDEAEAVYQVINKFVGGAGAKKN